MAMSDQGLRESVDLMRQRGLGPEAIKVFEYYYEQLEAGAQGTIPEDSIEPLGEIQDVDSGGEQFLNYRHALEDGDAVPVFLAQDFV